jgi:SAM-dependent methyltransferase
MGKGWEDWEWDPTLFEGAAAYYVRGRLPYADRLADVAAEALGLDGSGRLLDVGCGPGTVALRLAHLFAEIVGLDPDPDMLAEARRIAAERAIGNARWAHMRAEELPAHLGRFRLVTFAASFHWMDRPKVFSAVRAMLEPGGAVVHVDNGHQDMAPMYRETVADIRRRYLGSDTRAGQSVRNTSPGDEDAVFRAAGFAGPQLVNVPDGRRIDRTIDDIVAETFSASSSAPHLFGDRLDAFENELRVALRGVDLRVELPDNQLKIWRAA